MSLAMSSSCCKAPGPEPRTLSIFGMRVATQRNDASCPVGFVVPQGARDLVAVQVWQPDSNATTPTQASSAPNQHLLGNDTGPVAGPPYERMVTCDPSLGQPGRGSPA